MRTATLLAMLCLAAPLTAAPPVASTGSAVDLPAPAKATVVLQLNGWGKARTRLTKLIEKAVPGDAKALKEMVESRLLDLLDGRSLKGIDPEGRVFASINELRGIGEEKSPIDVFLPVKDAAAFRDAFFKAEERKEMVRKTNGVTSISVNGNVMFLVEKTGYLIVTASEDRANEFSGKYEILNTKKMGTDVSATFLAADVSIYVDLEKINDAFGDEIKQIRGLIDFGFQNAAGTVPGLDPSQLDAVKDMMKGVFQVVEDGRALVVGAEFLPEGLKVRIQGRFEKGSKTGAVLAGEVPEAHAGLEKMPRGLTEYSASRFGPSVSDAFEKMSREFSAGEDQDAAAKAIEQFHAAKKAAGVRGSITAGRQPDVTVTLTDCQDPAAFVKAYATLLKALPAGASHSMVVLKEKPAVKESAQTNQGIIFYQVSLVHDFDATAKKLPEAGKEMALEQLKKQVKEKATFWIGSDGSKVVQVTAPDWVTAKKVLDGLNSVTGVDAAFRATRSQLPAEASLFALQETGHVLNGIAEQIGSFGQSVPGLPIELPKINKVKAAPSFVGVAVVLKPEIGQLDLFVPADAIGIVRKAFEEK
ncbi:MAG TPA: hypothetical protein VGJ05_21865 [Fimbriiglobus sp.]|jgi:hypothetical protein